MKIFTKKGFLQKTIIVVLTVLCINFIVPTYSRADVGGVLMDPIVDLFCSIGDAVVNVLQRCMTGNWGAGFDWTKGGFLVSDDKFWGNSEYAKYQGGSASGTPDIDVDDPEYGFIKGWLGFSDKYYLPVATYSPEQIFSGSVSGLDINFINPTDKGAAMPGVDPWGTTVVDGETVVNSSAGRLQKTIASWYVALRNLATVALLSILVYVGIRIIISSTAADKAKYKQFLMDWLIALIILFFLHYIMSFTITIVQSITGAINGGGTQSVSITIKDSNGTHVLKTNLLGEARLKTQYRDFWSKIAYFIMYMALVIYTVVFTWFYLKRLLIMAFLTIIAPLVALTYPIDKMGDSKAQAFNSWLKEYVFNALIQPFHLIIYMVFVGSAMDLARNNIIYMIAALGFILPAEKILRGFFGFNQASSTLGALVGGAAIGNFLGKGAKAISSGASAAKSASGGGSGGGSGDSQKGPRFANKVSPSDIRLPEGQKSDSGLGEGSGKGSDQLGKGSNNGLPETKDMDPHPFGERPYSDDEWNDILEDQGLNPEMYAAGAGAGIGAGYGSETYGQSGNTQGLETEDNLRGRLKEPEDDSSNSKPAGTDNNDNSSNEEKKGFKYKAGNLLRYHTRDLGRKMGRGAIKGIKGAAKFATKKTFRLAGTVATGAIPAAVAMAAGGGLAGGVAAFATAGKIGGNLGDKAANGAIRAAGGFTGFIARERDIANGTNEHQRAREIKQFMKDEENRKLVQQQLIKEGKGRVPSSKEIDNRMKAYKPYLENGVSSVKEAERARKVAKDFNISDDQAAKMIALANDRDISKAVLNKRQDREQAMENLNQEFLQSVGGDQAKADALTKHTFNYLQALNGVAYDNGSGASSKQVRPASNATAPDNRQDIQRLQKEMSELRERQDREGNKRRELEQSNQDRDARRQAEQQYKEAREEREKRIRRNSDDSKPPVTGEQGGSKRNHEVGKGTPTPLSQPRNRNIKPPRLNGPDNK